MFEDLHLKRVDDKTYSIHQIVDQKLQKYAFETPVVLTPFAVEKYKGKLILNLEMIDYINDKEMNQFYHHMIEMDKFFAELDLIENDDHDTHDTNLKSKRYTSIIRQRGKYPPQLRTHLKKGKNMVITKYYEGKEEKSIFDIEKGQKIKCILEIGSIWIYNNSYGLVISVQRIEKV